MSAKETVEVSPIEVHSHTNDADGESTHDEMPAESAPNRPSVFRLIFLGVLVIAVFAGLTFTGIRSRSRQLYARDETSLGATENKPRVLIAIAERAPSRVEQTLPGTAYPEKETAVHARTSGYLRRWHVDIGDEVKEGQLLAEIETPEVDGQLLQARAALAESRATLSRNKASADLARINLGRIRESFDRGVGAKQEFDEAEAALKVALATVQVAEATIQANEANVKRLEDLQHFQRVTAPFRGVITARNYDPGALIVADNNAAGRELFRLAQIDTLRVFADVPQAFSTAVRAGQSAPVSRPEMPGREFTGKVSRTTSSVNTQTRTLRVEVGVPNPDHTLLPGMYLQVRFQLESAANLVRIPGAAVIVRAEGAKVAIVDSSERLTYRAVKLGRDYGTMIEVTDGLTGGERIVIRPGDDWAEGTLVEAVTASDR